jgi:hypothetical protein
MGIAIAGAITIHPACHRGSICTSAAAAAIMPPPAIAGAAAAPMVSRSPLPLLPVTCSTRPALSVLCRPRLIRIVNLPPLPLMEAPGRQLDLLCRCIAVAAAVAASRIPLQCPSCSRRCVACIALVQPVCSVGRQPAAIGVLRCWMEQELGIAAAAAAAVPLPPPSPAARTLKAVEAVILRYALQNSKLLYRHVQLSCMRPSTRS